MPDLTRAQTTAIFVLEWLLDPEERRQGRTTALAIALIRTALRTPGSTIAVRDFAGRVADPPLVHLVTSMIEADPFIREWCDWRQLTARARAPTLQFRPEMPPDPGWYPGDWNVDTNALLAGESLMRSLRVLDPQGSDPDSAPDGAFRHAFEVFLAQRNVQLTTLPPPERPEPTPARSLWERLDET